MPDLISAQLSKCRINSASVRVGTSAATHQVQLKTGLKDVLETDTREVFYLADPARVAA